MQINIAVAVKSVTAAVETSVPLLHWGTGMICGRTEMFLNLSDTLVVRIIACEANDWSGDCWSIEFDILLGIPRNYPITINLDFHFHQGFFFNLLAWPVNTRLSMSQNTAQFQPLVNILLPVDSSASDKN